MDSKISKSKSKQNTFFELTADKVVDGVESVVAETMDGVKATGRVLALNSLENRVYQMEFEDGSYVVAKYYRPDRWSFEQILEEHEFLQRLEEAEIPVVSPLELNPSNTASLITNSRTLAISSDGIFFSVFPRVRGRLSDELSKKQLETLGRYVGRMHQVGTSWRPKHRLRLDSESFIRSPLEFLLSSNFLDEHSRPHYKLAAENFLSIALTRIEDLRLIATHGDCHLGNVLWNGEAPFLMDFDDMMLAPAVQDVWMVVRGRDEEAKENREHFLRGYEQMFDFNHMELSLIEVLRGFRIIHYSSWIARRWADPSFPKAFPDFGGQAYWRMEMNALHEITDLLA